MIIYIAVRLTFNFVAYWLRVGLVKKTEYVGSRDSPETVFTTDLEQVLNTPLLCVVNSYIWQCLINIGNKHNK